MPTPVTRPSTRQQWAVVAALAVAWWLLTELASVWGPSLITIFGQAAETPAELMGLYALGCVLAALPLVWVTRRMPFVAAALALMCYLVLGIRSGGEIQLIASSLGVAAALAWLAHLAARHGPLLARGLAAGWFAVAALAAVTGTWWPVWRADPITITEAGVLLVLIGTTARPALIPTGAPGRRQAWSLLPVGLVAGIAVVAPGRASATDVTLGPLALGPIALLVGTLLALVAVGRIPARPWRAPLALVGIAAVALSLYGTATVDGAPGSLAPWTLLAFALGPVGLAALLLRDEGGRAAGPYAVAGGGVIWVLLFFAYYAGYDLGYRADSVIVAAAAMLALLATLRRPATHTLRAPEGEPRTAPWGPALVALAAVLGLGGVVAHRAPDPAPRSVDEVTVMAYNLRMGYGMAGRFEAREVASTVAGADVVLLSEIDRGWLLNGGQDQLAILARLTGKRAYFNPAADPVWGDAILTDLPVEELRGQALPSYGAVTGAGALAARIEVAGEPVWFVSTHVQPTATRDDGTLDQAHDLATLVEDLQTDGAQVVIGGDFNLEPDEPSFAAIEAAGVADALAAARPLPTSDAADPQQQIDHIFATPGLTASAPAAVATEASDHLPVRVTLTPAG